MKARTIFGIGLPILISLVLIVLSLSGSGFAVDVQPVESVKFDSLFTEEKKVGNSVLIETITVTNDYFMPRRYEIPNLVACLHDNEDEMELITLGVDFSGVSTRSGSLASGVADIFVESSYEKSVELEAHSVKTMDAHLNWKSYYNYNKELDDYRSYDELVVIESKEKRKGRYYYSYMASSYCDELSDDELNEGVRIPLVK
jgi:hypothetical protein